MTIDDDSDRYCINCGEPCPQPRTDPWFMFFCATCSDGLRPKDRSDAFVGWVRKRRRQLPDADLLDGQPDTNWPTGFPEQRALR